MTDACATVANTIARHAKLLGQQTETAYTLTGLGRDGMRPAVVTQEFDRGEYDTRPRMPHRAGRNTVKRRAINRSLKGN